MTATTINDWKSVASSLIGFLVKDGFTVTRASNGEDSITTENKSKLAAKVCECDEGTLNITKGDFRATLYLVLGNSPAELVADYGWKGDETELSTTLDKFSDSWEKRGNVCPKKTLSHFSPEWGGPLSE